MRIILTVKLGLSFFTPVVLPVKALYMKKTEKINE